MKLIKYTILGIISSVVIGQFAYASGLSVTPSKVEHTLSAGEETVITLTIANPTQDVSLVEVYADDFERNISPEVSSFTLEAHEDRLVDVTVLFNDAGTYSTYISVVTKALGDRSFNARSGIKIPVDVTVTEGSVVDHNWVLYGIITFDVVLLGVLIWLIVRKHLASSN